MSWIREACGARPAGATARAARLSTGTAAHNRRGRRHLPRRHLSPRRAYDRRRLALAQSQAANGENLLRAVSSGYEISTRIGRGDGPRAFTVLHNTGTIGCFGASAVRRSCSPSMAALRNAWRPDHVCAGLQHAFRMDSMSKPLHAGVRRGRA